MLRRAFFFWLTGVAGAFATGPTTDNWSDGGHDSSWATLSNWSDGLPGANSAVSITTQPTGGIVGVNTGSTANAIYSFTFAGTLTSGIQVLPAGVEQLQVSTSIGNASSFGQIFGLFVSLNGTALQSGTAGISFAGGLGLSQATTDSNSGAITLGTDAPFVLKLGASVGKLTTSGALNLNGSDLVLNASTTYANGTALTLLSANSESGHFGAVSFTGSYTGNFTQVSSGVWSTTANGQTWQFTEATGVLSNVPEPSAAGLLAAGALLLSRRGRRRESARG